MRVKGFISSTTWVRVYFGPPNPDPAEAKEINSTFVVAALFLLLVFGLQHGGILRAARVQTIIGIAVLVPLLIVGIVPLITGDVLTENFSPFVPLNGAWDLSGWTLLAGGLFIAAWSAYAFETSICYTAEFRDPGRDTVRAILAAGLACLASPARIELAYRMAGPHQRRDTPGPALTRGALVARTLPFVLVCLVLWGLGNLLWLPTAG